MGRLRTVSLILILCASGGATAVAATDDTTSATRQPPPAQPIKYLEAGSQLFNSGDVDKLELASKYLQAADRYRDMLEPEDRGVPVDLAGGPCRMQQRLAQEPAGG